MKFVDGYGGYAARLAAVLMIMGLLQGCGGGGGSAALPLNATPGPVGDTIANTNSNTGSVTTNSTGCTNATYVPNFAGSIQLYRWTRQPIRVRFLNAGIITKSDGTMADLEQTAIEGFQEWAAATNNGVTIQVTSDPAQTDVTVHFGTLPDVPTANDVLGLESSTLYSDNTIKSADVLLNTWPAMTAANVQSFRETAAHEFGHALGISGHSDSTLDVMYSAHLLTTGKSLSARDVNTLRTAYCDQFTREAISHSNSPTRVVTVQ